MDTTTLLLLFFASLALTVALLTATVITGSRHQRRAHLRLVPLAVISLVVSIFLAEQSGRRFTFAPGIRSVHLMIAKVSTLLILAPIITGFLSLKSADAHPLHGKSVFLFLVGCVATVVTGTWMMLTGTLIQS